MMGILYGHKLRRYLFLVPLHLSSLTDTFDCLLQCCVCIYIKVDRKEMGLV